MDICTWATLKSSIYVSDEISRLATSDDIQMVARCARILIYKPEQDTQSKRCSAISVLSKSVMVRAAEAVASVPGSVLVAPALAVASSGSATVRIEEQHKRKNKQSECVAQANTGGGPDGAAAVITRMQRHI